MKVVKGDIYYANLDPVIGSEQDGIRPVIVLENIVDSDKTTVIVVPLTRFKNNKAKLNSHVIIKKKNKLLYDSIALVEQIRTIDVKRISSKFIMRISDKEIKKIENRLCNLLEVKRRK